MMRMLLTDTDNANIHLVTTLTLTLIHHRLAHTIPGFTLIQPGVTDPTQQGLIANSLFLLSLSLTSHASLPIQLRKALACVIQTLSTKASLFSPPVFSVRSSFLSLPLLSLTLQTDSFPALKPPVTCHPSLPSHHADSS